jgi:hypothetical protein
MAADRIAEISKELAALCEELQRAETAHIVHITDRIDVLIDELMHLGRGIVSAPKKSN